MLSLVLFVCVLCSVYVWLKYIRGQSSAHALPPAAWGKLPIIGHTYLLLIKDLWDLFNIAVEDSKKKGGLSYAYFGNELYYIITDPQDALTVANSCLKRHFAFDYCKSWLGNSIGISYGDIWKQHRRILNPAFSLPVIHSFLDAFNSQARNLVTSVDSFVGKGPFDVSFKLEHNALETLCVGTFGINAIDDTSFTHKYIDAFPEILRLFKKRVVNIWLASDLVYWLVGMQKRQDELVNTLLLMSNKVIQQKRSAIKENPSNNNLECSTSGLKYKPFLDHLLDLSENGTFTDTDIREELDNIIATGFETTSNQLTYIMKLLGAHPEVQEKLYEELIQVLGVDKDVGKDDVSKLVYTNAVILESLRVNPSVPIIWRYADKDVKLSNYTMRAGSYCVVSPAMVKCDDKFRPERWLDGDFKKDKGFAGFGLGKRSCIGETYAIMTMKVILAHFIRRYKLKASTDDIKVEYILVAKPMAGHEISIERRM